MEAVPRLPMICFDLKICTENTQFAPKLKQYIATFYNEDPESYNNEIHNLQGLRATAIRPTIDLEGCKTLKRYYCQLHFLKSRFPMEENQAAAVDYSWKDNHASLNCTLGDIRFELTCVLYNIGALHTQLGVMDSRVNPEGMKMACSHFQCAAWAFQTLKEQYHQFLPYISSFEFVHFMQTVCLAQAQECILEKSMLDNRKALIIAKVAVEVHDYYRKSLSNLQSLNEDSSYLHDLVGSKPYKEWIKYLNFKVAYHKCIALLFQGQQAEEQQKMGERVSFYQAACDKLEEARKIASGMKNSQFFQDLAITDEDKKKKKNSQFFQDLSEALAFTSDVVEGKRKAAKNENEFIYHEDVPIADALPQVKGASLVKGTPFSVNDVEVSGPDLFARLVPMEAHEASSLYSERKAELLRSLGELVETKDQSLVEFMSSMQLDMLGKIRGASGIPQELVDRAAALSAKPSATQDLIDVMGKLSNIYQEVEAMLKEIEEYLAQEEKSEKEYQEVMGKRPPSIIATDLSREAAKYKEAHLKANESNQTLHRAMTAHVANLKILGQPLRQLQQQLPSVEMPNPNIDENALRELESLVAKVEEMRSQRAMLWAQFREAIHKDDVTGVLVTKSPETPLEEVFKKELEKHDYIKNLIEQNATAQENIKKALIEAYANSLNTRRYVQEVINKRASMISALIASFDSYEDLLAKANKGIEFYTKLETNVSKLLQRIKAACKVQQEERDGMLAKNQESGKQQETGVVAGGAPKLKDYLDARKKNQDGGQFGGQVWSPGVRPTPVGSEVNSEPPSSKTQEVSVSGYGYGYGQTYTGHNPTAYNGQGQNYSQAYGQTYMYQNPGPNQNMTDGGYDQYNSGNVTGGYGTVGASTGYGTGSVPSSSQNVPNSYATNMPNSTPTSLQAYITGSGASSGYVSPQQATYSSAYASQYTPSQNQHLSGQNISGYSSETPASLQNPSGGYNTYPNSISGTYQQNSTLPSTPVADAKIDELSSRMNSLLPKNQDKYSQSYGQTGYTNPYYGAPSTPVSYDYDPSKAFTTTTNSYQPITTPQVEKAPAGQKQTYGQYYEYSNPGTSTPYQYYHQYPNTSSYNSTYSNYNTIQQPATSTGFSCEYASSVTPNVVNLNNSTYSSPLGNSNTASSDSKQVLDGSNYSYNYQVYGNPGYASNYGNPVYANYYAQYDSNYSANQSYQVPSQQPTSVSTSTTVKESNVDLLSGLDFTVSQAPLVPQQNTNISVANETNKVQEIKEEIEKAKVEKKVDYKVLPSKSLNNTEVRKLFDREIEKYEKFVEGLSSKTLNGLTNLDLKWKEIQDKEVEAKKVISVARCYPLKNRFADILPYDYSRVEIMGTKDDYINASYVKDVSPFAPLFIATQLPLSSTVSDFWTMIREQQVELIFCLLSDSEIRNDIYWPIEKSKNLSLGNMEISLQSVIVKPNWTERLISVSVPEKRESTVVMHVQFTCWPGSLFPTSPEAFVSYTTEMVTLFQQQRNISHPVVVHCLSGIGRSGLLIILATAILEAANNNLIPDLATIACTVGCCRRNILRDREHLKFAFEAFLHYMKKVNLQDKVKKLAEVVVEKEEVKAVEIKETGTEDPLSSLDPFWKSK